MTSVPGMLPASIESAVAALLEEARRGRVFTRREHFSANDKGDPAARAGTGFEVSLSAFITNLDQEPVPAQGSVRVINHDPVEGFEDEGGWLTVTTTVSWTAAFGLEHASSTLIEISLQTPGIRAIGEQTIPGGARTGEDLYHMLTVADLRDRLQPHANLLFPDTQRVRLLQLDCNAFNAQATSVLALYAATMAADRV